MSGSYISQIVWRRSRAGGARSQVGHARGAAGPALRGLRARPAHKHGLAHERLSSRVSERPSARRSFSTNLLWNLSESRARAGGLAEPLLGLSVWARSEAREGGARQYDSERMAGAERCGLSAAALRGDSAGPSDRDSDTFRTRPPLVFCSFSDVRRDRCELYMSQSFFITGIMNAISAVTMTPRS